MLAHCLYLYRKHLGDNMDRLKLYFFILHLSVICSVTTFAGVSDSTTTKTDSTEEWHDWDDMKDDDFEWTDEDEEKWKRYVKRSCCWGWSDKPEFMDFDFTDVYDEYESPFISFRYGNVNHSLKNLRSGLQKTGLAEFQLGYNDISQLEKDSPIIGYTSNFFRGGKYSVDLKSESLLSNDIEAEIWRFGIGWDKGYGYDLGVSKLVLYRNL